MYKKNYDIIAIKYDNVFIRNKIIFINQFMRNYKK